jgi:hypothetical protein
MAKFGSGSLPMLEKYFLKAISVGNTEEAERLKQQIISIKSVTEPEKTQLDSGQFSGTEDEPLYPFLSGG